MTRIIHSNNASATLTNTITSSQTTIVLSNVTNFPTLASGDVIRITVVGNNLMELMDITNDSSAPTYTVIRGVAGSTAQAIQAGAIVEIRDTAEAFDAKQDRIATAGDAIDFGNATSLEIPNSATPAFSADGQLALDNTITGYSHGLICYQSTSVYGIPAILLSDLTSPTDTYVIAYDATNTKFKLVAQSGGGGGGGSYTGTAGQIDISGGNVISIDPTYVGQPSITTLGTISSGTWNGTPINLGGSYITGTAQPGNGGTGLSSPGSSGNVLTSNGSGWVSSAPSGGGGLTRVSVNAPTFTMAADTEYTVAGGGAGIPAVGTLPTGATEGQIVSVSGKGSGGWQILIPSGSAVNNVASSYSTSITSTNTNDCITLRSQGGNQWVVFTVSPGSTLTYV